MEYIIVINILSCKWILMFPDISFQAISRDCCTNQSCTSHCQISISIGMYHPVSDRLDVVIGSLAEIFFNYADEGHYLFSKLLL